MSEHFEDSHADSHRFEERVTRMIFQNGKVMYCFKRIPGVKPFKCPECHLCFRTTGHRQSHLKSHRKASLAATSGTQTVVSQTSAAIAKKKIVTKFVKEPVR